MSRSNIKTFIPVNSLPKKENFDEIIKKFIDWDSSSTIHGTQSCKKDGGDACLDVSELPIFSDDQPSQASDSAFEKGKKAIEGEAYKRLMSLPGLEEVKKEVNRQLSYQTVMNLRKEKGLKVPSRLLHMLLAGNPGTGKTTVARLIGKIYCEAGLLPKDVFVEANRATLVGRYIGDTEQNTAEAIEKAKGGVLFIDEIYSLATEMERDFGHRALDTLMPVLSDTSTQLMVIGAGYPDRMKNFLKANPGLTSRFPTILQFADYDLDTLLDIARNHLKEYDFCLHSDAEAKLRDLVSFRMKSRDAGNARMVMTVLENDIIPAMCSRIFNFNRDASANTCNTDYISMILPEDIPQMTIGQQPNNRKIIGYR